MQKMPSTPRWLKRAAWFSLALLGLVLCVLICTVEQLLEGGFPWAYLLLCVLQSAACILSGLFCGKPAIPRPAVLAIGIAAAVLSAAVLTTAAFWLSFLRS